MKAMKTYEINVYGTVQGVGFRAYVYDKAIDLNIKGFVKNMYDGSVKIIAQGYEQSIQLLIEYAKKGPIMAHVNDLVFTVIEESEIYNSFDIN